MKVTVLLSVFLCCTLGTNSVIIPDELPSLLSVIYSNIPTLKKGTDSRLGWGFRFGDRADFQVLVELGPQKYTEPLRNQQPQDGNSKRSTIENLADTLYAQNQALKQLKTLSEREQFMVQNRIQEKERKENASHKKSTNRVPNPDAANWLKSWSTATKKQNKHQHQQVSVSSRAKPGLGIGEIDAKSVLPADEENRSAMKSKISQENTTGKTTTTTSKKDALDNVDLE